MNRTHRQSFHTRKERRQEPLLCVQGNVLCCGFARCFWSVRRTGLLPHTATADDARLNSWSQSLFVQLPHQRYPGWKKTNDSTQYMCKWVYVRVVGGGGLNGDASLFALNLVSSLKTGCLNKTHTNPSPKRDLLLVTEPQRDYTHEKRTHTQSRNTGVGTMEVAA